MIVDNVRVIGRNRNPYVQPGYMHTAESYYYMMEKLGPDSCLVFDVTVIKGDKKFLTPEKFVHEFMEKNFPDVVYHLERHIQAFDGMLEALQQNGKAFVYYYCYSRDKEAIDKLYRFVNSKLFMAKVHKYLEEVEEE